jgi:hypothetical protein
MKRNTDEEGVPLFRDKKITNTYQVGLAGFLQMLYNNNV